MTLSDLNRFPAPTRRALVYAAIAAAYVAAYLALNLATAPRNLNGSSITLWSPDNALSVMLIMESWTFTPVVWAAQIAVDLWLSRSHSSLPAVISAESTLAAGYLGMAMSLRHVFGLNIRDMRPRDLLAVMAVAPPGAALTGLVYCGALVAIGELPSRAFWPDFAGFWIGDAAAMGVVIPAAGAMFRIYASAPWRRARIGYPLLQLAAVFLFITVVVALSASALPRRYLFDLLFLPILMVGLKFGYNAGALTLLYVQLTLVIAMDAYHVPDVQYGAYQIMMFTLAISGLALGATVSEWQEATAKLRTQQAELAKVSERATNGAMGAAMAHEISQPLASVAAYLHGARRLLENDVRDRALEALLKAEREAARARVVIERLRDFVATGVMARERVDLEAVVEDVLRWQADAARDGGVRLRRAGPPGRPLHVIADKVGVEQAISNLVRNAIEAVAEAGGGSVAVGLEMRDGRAVVAVEDDGPGVAAEIVGRLFEPFETTKARGMGLGLPLAREVASRQGGRLAWTPLAPHGARFALELPLT